MNTCIVHLRLLTVFGLATDLAMFSSPHLLCYCCYCLKGYWKGDWKGFSLRVLEYGFSYGSRRVFIWPLERVLFEGTRVRQSSKNCERVLDRVLEKGALRAALEYSTPLRHSSNTQKGNWKGLLFAGARVRFSSMLLVWFWLVWFRLVWFGFGLIWFWFGLI